MSQIMRMAVVIKWKQLLQVILGLDITLKNNLLQSSDLRMNRLISFNKSSNFL